MPLNEYIFQMDQSQRIERVERTIRSRDGSRARAAWLRRRAATPKRG